MTSMLGLRRGVRRLRATPVQLGPKRVAAEVDDGKRARRLSFEFSVPATATGDFVLPATLLQAMSVGFPLNLAGAVDPRMLVRQEDVQRRVADSEPALRPVPVTAAERPSTGSHSHGVATFFSGGVDSFYTLLRRRDEITHLIVIRGFDLALDDGSTWDRIVAMARRVGGELGLEVIEVETDAKEIASPLVTWHWYHPCVLAAVAQALEQVAGRVLISAGHTDHDLTRRLDPTLDPTWTAPLWSTSRVELEICGADVTRLQKVERIADSELAMRWLRVCWREPREWNCGRCEKCIRTMLNLVACGALERCRTLPDQLDPEAVRALVLRDAHARIFARESLDRLRREGAGDELVAALDVALRRSPYRAAKRRAALLPVHVAHRVRRMWDR
jgi:hypothetical protein